jgi:hypothetical protein
MDESISVKVPFIKKVTEFDKGGKKGEITFKFRNGTQVVLLLSEVSEANKHHAFVHGISQKAGDTYAGASKTNDFSGAFDGLQSVIAQLATDEWSKTGDGFLNHTQLFQAVALVMKKAVEDVADTWETLTDAEKKTWTGHSKVKVELAKMKLEAAKKAETSDTTLAGF